MDSSPLYCDFIDYIIDIYTSNKQRKEELILSYINQDNVQEKSLKIQPSENFEDDLKFTDIIKKEFIFCLIQNSSSLLENSTINSFRYVLCILLKKAVSLNKIPKKTLKHIYILIINSIIDNTNEELRNINVSFIIKLIKTVVELSTPLSIKEIFKVYFNVYIFRMKFIRENANHWKKYQMN